MAVVSRRRIAATIPFPCLLSIASPAFAQAPPGSGAGTGPVPEIVVTATRSPLSIARAGSAISVIPAEEIQRSSSKSVADLLRTVPGLSVVETGGPGATTTVRIRGAEARQTLVLIDGIRVNDPSAGAGEFDFSNLVLTDVERIEVVRGPQSALYGSDAIGGVINVITRKGRGKPRVSVSAEGGSYGSKALRGSISGSEGPVSYAFSATGYDTAGFSRYGFRVRRITGLTPFPLEADSTRRFGASGRVGVKLSDNVEVEVGGSTFLNAAQYDASFGQFPDTPSFALARVHQTFARTTALAFDGALRNTVTLYGNRTDRSFRDISYFDIGLPDPASFGTRDDFTGDRYGAEYQGDLSLGAFGTLTFGTKIEREGIETFTRPFLPVPGLVRTRTNNADQTTRSAYLLHQFTIAQNTSISLAGRVDDVLDVDRFVTGRITLAHEIPASETKLRASLGTGAKAPALFQLFDPSFGNPDLVSERSIGVDAGVDQVLLDGRIKISATVFQNRFRNLLDFASSPACPPNRAFGCFVNVARAQSFGFELSGDFDIVPRLVRMRIAYTYLDATDRLTGLTLARRPENEGRIGLTITPIERLTIQPVLLFVDQRFSSNGETDRLPAYARFDISAEYQATDSLTIFARGENLTNTRYEDVKNFGTAGVSFYGGLRGTW